MAAGREVVAQLHRAAEAYPTPRLAAVKNDQHTAQQYNFRI
jgi:hypothetical protein